VLKEVSNISIDHARNVSVYESVNLRMKFSYGTYFRDYSNLIGLQIGEICLLFNWPSKP